MITVANMVKQSKMDLLLVWFQKVLLFGNLAYAETRKTNKNLTYCVYVTCRVLLNVLIERKNFLALLTHQYDSKEYDCILLESGTNNEKTHPFFKECKAGYSWEKKHPYISQLLNIIRLTRKNIY